MSEANLSDLLDANLDDLADLPEFKPYPNGAHKVTIKWEQKKVNDHPALELKLKAIETVELADASEQPLQAGAETSVLYMLDNEFGQGKLKEFIKPLAEHLGVTKIGQVVEQSNGMEVVVVTKIRQNKDKTQSYTDISKVTVA